MESKLISQENSVMRLFIILTLLTFSNFILSQEFKWDKNYGGTELDWIYDMVISPDGHLVGIGSSNSNDFDLDGSNPGSPETWFLSVDQNGNVITSKTIPLDQFADLDEGSEIINYENGFMFTNGREIIRINNQGDIIWRINNFDPGTSFLANNASLQAFSDGSFFMLSENVASNSTSSYYWLGKFNASGELQWSNTYGGSGFETPKSMLVDNNGNPYLFGHSTSDDGDVSGHYGNDVFADIWIVHVDGNTGEIIWEKNYGGTGNDEAQSILFTDDGTLMFLATIMFIDEDIEEEPNNFGRNWVVEINRASLFLRK